MSADKNDVLLLCEEIAYFLFNIFHLLLTQVLPLIGLLVGSLFLHLFRLSRSLVSSRGRVSPRNHAACRPAQTASSTYREAAEPLEIYEDGLQNDLDRDEDGWIGVDHLFRLSRSLLSSLGRVSPRNRAACRPAQAASSTYGEAAKPLEVYEDGLQGNLDRDEDDWIGAEEDRLVYATVNEQKLEEKPPPDDLQGRQGKDREIERSEKDGAAEAGGQDTQSLDGEGGLQEGSGPAPSEAGDGDDGASVKLRNTGLVPAISTETGNQQSVAQRFAGTFGLGDDEDKEDAREYTPPWLRPQLSMQSPSDLPPDLHGVIVAAAVNNEGRAVAAQRPLAPTFSTVAKQLPLHDKKPAAYDRPAPTAGESDKPA